jgi:anaerobic carbon-monoxide dehydrogenase iron sulfur subunit
VKFEADGVDRPALCRQCADAPCAAACPTGALVADASNGGIHFNPDDCIVCPACAAACPFGVVFLDPTTQMPLICDLCAGRPACVKRCVTGALSVAHPAPARRDAPADAGPGDV